MVSSKYFFAVLLAAGLLTGCAAPDEEPEKAAGSHLAEIREEGKLVMLSFPSMEGSFVRPNLESGKPTQRVGAAEDFAGVEVDLMQRFAERLGVELEIHTLDAPGYGPLIPALTEGRADLIASGLSITEERREVVDFAEPYYTVHKLVITREDSEIDSVDDLPGHTAVAIPGSSHEEHLRRLGIAGEDIYPVEFTSEYFTAVEDRDADFAIVDSTTARRNLGNLSRFVVAFQLEGEDPYGWAIPKGSDLRGELGAFLEEVRASGELQEILDRHLERP